MLGPWLPFFAVLDHWAGMSMVSTLAWFDQLFGSKGCITQVFSRGKTGTGMFFPRAAASAAPSMTWFVQLTICTTRMFGKAGIGLGRLSKYPCVQGPCA